MTSPELHVRPAHTARSASMIARRTRLGAALLEPFIGCQAANALRAEWHPNIETVQAQDDQWIKLPGLPPHQAGRFASSQRHAMLMAISEAALERLEAYTLDHSRTNHAVAIRSDDAVHIAVHPQGLQLFKTIDRLGFGRFSGDYAVGLRRDRRPLEATMGMWIPEEEAFVGADQLMLASPLLPVAEFTPLSQSIPDVRLVV